MADPTPAADPGAAAAGATSASDSEKDILAEFDGCNIHQEDEGSQSESGSDAETVMKNAFSLQMSYDPVSMRPIVQMVPTQVRVKSRRKKKTKSTSEKEKKKAYDKQRKATSQAQKEKKARHKKERKHNAQQAAAGKGGAVSKNARKRLVRLGISIEASEGADVIDSPFQDKGEEKKVLELQGLVKKSMKDSGIPLNLVSTTDKLEDLLNKKIQAQKKVVTKDDGATEEEDDENVGGAFYLIDLGTVVRKYVQWVHCFPRVQPFYAVKCNPDNNIVRTIKTCGGCFDCASINEIKQALEIGSTPDEIIFANPAKPLEAIKFAKSVGVRKMTFDNEMELRKIHKTFPEAELVLRILGDDSKSLMQFGSKFGARVPDETTPIIEVAREIGAKLVGVSFHVGSWCTSESAFITTLEMAKSVFDVAEKNGIKMSLLDIGGGWPGFDTEDLSFRAIAKPIRAALDRLFPDPNLRMIAEPGRYFVSECAVLATRIIARRQRQIPGGDESAAKNQMCYYLADGVYGSFNNIFFDHYKPQANVLHNQRMGEDTLASSPLQSTLFGPTCDSVDVIAKDIDLPSLETGDYLYFCNMGAYTLAASTTFNGMNRAEVTYMISVPEEILKTEAI